MVRKRILINRPGIPAGVFQEFIGRCEVTVTTGGRPMKPGKFAVAFAVIVLFVSVRPQKLPAQGLFGTISGIVRSEVTVTTGGRPMKPGKFAVAFAVIVLFVSVRPQKLPAQGLFGTISGIVTDPSGAVVAGA